MQTRRAKAHWSYRVFKEKRRGHAGNLKFPDDYASMQINPRDNVENLAEGYIDNNLASLSLGAASGSSKANSLMQRQMRYSARKRLTLAHHRWRVA